MIFLRCVTRGSSGLLIESASILKDALVTTSKLKGATNLKKRKKRYDRCRELSK